MQIRPARLADVPGIARVHVDAWRSTYPGIVPAEYLASLSYEAMAQRRIQALENPALHTLVVEDAQGRIVGFATGGKNRDEGDTAFTGELYALYLLAEVQRRGLGGRLTRAFAHSLVEDGHDSMRIWVLDGNPAAHFYAALGGVPASEKWVEIGGARLREIGYGWRGLGAWLAGKG